MAEKLSTPQLKLYDAIDDILRRDCDPIGIGSFVEAQDEYATYVPQVFKLALNGDRGRIADYLFEVATDRMGLTTHRNQHLGVADKVFAAKEQLGLGNP